MEATGGPGVFCLSIFSTGIKRFWQLGFTVVVEPLTNQIAFPCGLSQEMLPMKSTLSKMTSQCTGLLPKKLILEVSGLDAGKFRMMQLPWMLIWAGGTGLTKPSITPLFCGEGQLSAAYAGIAVSSNSAKANGRILLL